MKTCRLIEIEGEIWEIFLFIVCDKINGENSKLI